MDASLEPTIREVWGEVTPVQLWLDGPSVTEEPRGPLAPAHA